MKLQDALIGTKGDSLVSPPDQQGGERGHLHRDRDDSALRPRDRRPGEDAAVGVIPENTGDGVAAYVGGTTAGNVDLAAEITDRLPIVILTILLLSMLVLMVAFRSLLIPLQAALTNLVTALAAFGVLTAVFQWGWGISLVGVETTARSVPIASYVPLMMFAILFGLRMDYQVFLLSCHIHHALRARATARRSRSACSGARGSSPRRR